MNEVEELLQKDNQVIMRSIIQRIATGPDMSKDISLEEARAGMKAILEDDIDPVQSAIFLIALRMKRESDDENKGILDGIRDKAISITADVDEVPITDITAACPPPPLYQPSSPPAASPRCRTA